MYAKRVVINVVCKVCNVWLSSLDSSYTGRSGLEAEFISVSFAIILVSHDSAMVIMFFLTRKCYNAQYGFRTDHST